LVFPASSRPASITALTILHITAGIIDVLSGLLFLVAFNQPTSFAASFIGVQAAYSFLLAPIAVAWFTLGVLAFIVAAFLWKGKGWAWLFGLILATDALVLGGFGLLLGSVAVALPLAVYGLILIFLALNQVRAYCGRTYVPGPFMSPPVPAMVSTAKPMLAAPAYVHPQYGPAVQQPYAPRLIPAQHPTWTVGTCMSCGAPLQGYGSFCQNCGARFR